MKIEWMQSKDGSTHQVHSRDGRLLGSVLRFSGRHWEVLTEKDGEAFVVNCTSLRTAKECVETAIRQETKLGYGMVAPRPSLEE